MPLTDADLSRLEPETRDRKLFDGRGLYLLVRSNGARYWRLKYRFAGKEKVLALGVWPQVSLQDARQAADMARDQLGRGLDPMQARQRPQPAPSASDTPNTTPKAPVMEPIRQSQKLANVCYDIRGPIMERARRREEDGQRIMKQAEITIRVNLGRGQASTTVWTCDLSHDYVSINADYRS